MSELYVNGTNHTLSFVISSRHLGAGQLEVDTMGEEEHRALELSNSLPLLHRTAQMVAPNWVDTYVKNLKSQ